jgi:DNA-binding beta-propeller fold protein YncE
MTRTGAALMIATLTACAADDLGGAGPGADAGAWGGSDASGGTAQCFSSSECPVGYVCSEFGTCVAPPPGGDAGVPPPPEVEYALTDPTSSRRFVWVAMIDQDRLAKIDAANLEVTAIPVGDRPRVFTTLPGTDTAVVLDGGNAAATVVRPAAGSAATELYPTLPNLNRLEAAPGGRYAVAFFDLAKAIAEAGSLAAVGQLGSFQDVTVLALQPGSQRAVDLTVGFRPREVELDATGRYAYVITDDGVSVIDLPLMTAGEPTIVPPVPLFTDPAIDARTAEVDIVASGAYAVARLPGAAALRVVRLLPPGVGTGYDVPLPAAPTDLDLAPDGSRVYAVFRNPTGLAEIEIPADAIDPSGISVVGIAGATGGSLVTSADGRRGLLYTNASLDERLTVVELDQPGLVHRTFPLQKAVRAVGFDPTGAKAIVLHARAPGDPQQATSFDEFIDRSHGYSVVDLATGFAKLQVTPVNPEAFTFAPGAARAYVTLDGGAADGAVTAVQTIELDTGVVRTTSLGSTPSALGVVPDSGKVFVSQDHPLGRVTFLDVVSGEVRTLTGFDLNSRVID